MEIFIDRATATLQDMATGVLRGGDRRMVCRFRAMDDDKKKEVLAIMRVLVDGEYDEAREGEILEFLSRNVPDPDILGLITSQENDGKPLEEDLEIALGYRAIVVADGAGVTRF